MDKSDCIKFATENPICSIATCEGDQPKVRMFGMWRADDTGFYFASGTPKPVCRQLENNPNVELCFYEMVSPPQIGRMMRVAGQAEFVEDMGFRTQMVEDMPFLKQMGLTGPEDPNLALLHITGEAYIWSMNANWQESESERITF